MIGRTSKSRKYPQKRISNRRHSYLCPNEHAISRKKKGKPLIGLFGLITFESYSLEKSDLRLTNFAHLDENIE